MCLITRIGIGTISNCSLVSSPTACLRQPQAHVRSCSGSSWMTSIRGSSTDNGLRLPRCLVGATTSSSTSSTASSGSLSGSLNSASCGVLGSTVCSDFRPNKRSRKKLDLFFQINDVAFMGFQHLSCFCLTGQCLSNNCLSRTGSSGRSLCREIIARIIPVQTTKRGLKT